MLHRREHARVECACGAMLMRCVDPSCLGCVPAVLAGCAACVLEHGVRVEAVDLLPLDGEM